MTRIHKTAIVDPEAQLDADVAVGAYSVVGPKVVLKKGVIVESHVVISGRTTIGERTRIWPFASVGSDPQDLKYRGEDSELIIGQDNRIREYSNISTGTEGGGNKTVIGNRNLLMVYTHVAHDCIVGDDCVFANVATLAGHVTVGNHVTIGGLAAVHQFCHVGDLAMLAGGAMVVGDVPPYCMVHGDRATLAGLNVVGLRRAGLKDERFEAIKTMFRLLYKENLTKDDAVARILSDVISCPERDLFVDFLKKSERGVIR